jgi:hypothetical protein
MSSSTPDLVVPIEGWRSWLIAIERGEPRLRSVVRSDLWEPAQAFAATCSMAHGSEAIPRHRPASRACSCGVHAARLRSEAEGHLAPPSRRTGIAAIGRVALWGTVVEGEYGWRASFGYPVALDLVTWRTDRDVLADLGWVRRSLADAYGVQVGIARPTPTADVGRRARRSSKA